MSPTSKKTRKAAIEKALKTSYAIIMRKHNLAQAIKKIIPMLDRILVKRAEAVTTTQGGIVLPVKAVAKVLQGTVVAVGPGSRNPTSGSHFPVLFKEGDRVLLPSYGGTKVEMEDEEYFLFRESDILAKLE